LIKAAVLTVLLWIVIALLFYAGSLTFDLKTISDMPQRSSVYDKRREILQPPFGREPGGCAV
jgi:hypothetical protein